MSKEIFLYILFGVLTTGIGVGGYTILLNLNLNYVIASLISWIIAVIFAYVTNRKLVFSSTVSGLKATLKECTSFFASRLGTLLVETISLVVLVEYLNVSKIISKYVLAIVVIVLNYILSKFIVFSRVDLS